MYQINTFFTFLFYILVQCTPKKYLLFGECGVALSVDHFSMVVEIRCALAFCDGEKLFVGTGYPSFGPHGVSVGRQVGLRDAIWIERYFV